MQQFLSGNITDDTGSVYESDPEHVYDVYHWKPQIGDTVLCNFKIIVVKNNKRQNCAVSSNDGMVAVFSECRKICSRTFYNVAFVHTQSKYKQKLNIRD